MSNLLFVYFVVCPGTCVCEHICKINLLIETIELF